MLSDNAQLAWDTIRREPRKGIPVGGILDRLWFPHFARSIQPLLDADVTMIWHCDGNLMEMVPRLRACRWGRESRWNRENRDIRMNRFTRLIRFFRFFPRL